MPSVHPVNNKHPLSGEDTSTLAPSSLNPPWLLAALRNMESWMMITLLSAFATLMFAIGIFI